MFKPILVKPLLNYKLWLKYADGTVGEVDLSHLAGKGVLAFWNNYANFEKVHIGESGQIAWNDEIDLCSDALYMKISGKKPEELFPNLKWEKAKNMESLGKISPLK